MAFSFPARITLENRIFETNVSRVDGLFRMRLGETEFECRNLYGWEAIENSNSIPEIFQFDESRELKFTTVQYRIPQILLHESLEIPATLTLTFNSNVPRSDPEHPWEIELDFGGKHVKRSMTGIYFETDYPLLEKEHGASLPLKNCFGCTYSDYSPYGGDMIGTMLCFRVCKSEYLATRNKDDLFDLWEKFVVDVEAVPEIYACEEFTPRDASKHIGYRG